jgi:exopolysaccharide biosynthesis polyprenyl glycosylphosphotransferase
MDAEFRSGTAPGKTAGGLLGPERRPRVALPGLRLRTSERKLLLLTVDLLIVNAALVVAWVVGANSPVTPQTVLAPYKWFITLTIVWGVSALFFDVYDLARSASTTQIVRNAGAAALVTVLVYVLIPWFAPPLASRTLIFAFALGAWLGIVAWRVAYAQLFVQPWFKRRALIVGAGWAGRTLEEMLRLAPHDANPYRGTGYQIVGFVDDNAAYADGSIGDVPVLGGHDVLVPAARALHVDEVILAITHRHAIDATLFDELLRCRELGVQVTPMAEVYERLSGRVPVDHVGRDLYAALPTGDRAYERFYLVVKAVIDGGFALLGLGVLALVAPAVAIANALTSPGPLLYRQDRVGKGGRSFMVVKFRSMVPDAEAKTGAVWAATNDDRVTPVGRFLRKTRLDELPQVINILRGEMSLIGPRPERPGFVEDLAKALPFYRARHAVRPGITGWAQVQYRYGNTSEDAKIKLEYDLYYVKHIGALLDFRIVLRTIQVMLLFKGQ